MSSCSLISQNNHIARKKTFRNSELNKVEFIWGWGSSSQFWTCFPHFFPANIMFPSHTLQRLRIILWEIWSSIEFRTLREKFLFTFERGKFGAVKSQKSNATRNSWLGVDNSKLGNRFGTFSILNSIVIYAINFNWERGSLGVDKWLTGWLWKTYIVI